MANPIPASLDFLKRKPARLHLQSLGDPSQHIEAQFNPEQVRETFAANYARLSVLGLSHKPLQYQNTENEVLDLTLAFRVYDREGNKLASNDAARRFLMSHFVSPRGATTIAGARPRRLLVVWPNFFSLCVTLTKMTIAHTFFGIDGTPYHFAADCSFEKDRQTRLTAEDVITLGTQRGQG